eukprot:6908065-Prymnesium_polylepis.1
MITRPVSRGRRNVTIGAPRFRDRVPEAGTHDTTDTTFRPFPTFLTCDSTVGVGLFDEHCPEQHSVGSNDAAFLPNGPIDA